MAPPAPNASSCQAVLNMDTVPSLWSASASQATRETSAKNQFAEKVWARYFLMLPPLFRWIFYLIISLFLLPLLVEYIFLTTLYGLYFNHQLHIYNQLSRCFIARVSSSSISLGGPTKVKSFLFTEGSLKVGNKCPLFSH